MNDWVLTLPNIDDIKIFGFNQLQEKSTLSVKAVKTLGNLSMLCRALQLPTQPGYEDLDLNLENISYKLSLARSSLEHPPNLHALPGHIGGADGETHPLSKLSAEYFNPDAIKEVNVEALLPLFVQL